MESVRRIFARTTWRNPHEHTFRRGQDEAVFVAAAEHLRQHGYEAWVEGRLCVQHEVGAYSIWAEDNPIAPPILINQKFRSPQAPARLKDREMGKQRSLPNGAQPALFVREEER